MKNFEQALQGLKMGYKVARKGWNGKGMFIKMFGRLIFTCNDNVRFYNYENC